MEPAPPAEAAPPASQDAGNSAPARKTSWCILWTLLFPVWWLLFALGWLFLFRKVSTLIFPYSLPSLLRAEMFVLVTTGLVAAWLCVFLARRGLKRNWNTAGGLRRSWAGSGLLVAGIIAAALFDGSNSNQSAMDKAIIGQARQLSAAADQYFLENGVSTVAYESLVGPANYIKAIQIRDREIYPAFYTQGSTITVTGIAGARTVTYAP